MKYIVVLNPNASQWQVLDKTFTSCPQSPIIYDDIGIMNPVPILGTCLNVDIKSGATGAMGIATPIKIEE